MELIKYWGDINIKNNLDALFQCIQKLCTKVAFHLVLPDCCYDFITVYIVHSI